MKKNWLIIRHEFLKRIKKRSFLIATILTPLIFPVVIGSMAYFSHREQQQAGPLEVNLYDETRQFQLKNSKRVTFLPQNVQSVEEAKQNFMKSDAKLLLVIAGSTSDSPAMTLYTKKYFSAEKIYAIEYRIAEGWRELKLSRYKIDKKIWDDLQADVPLKEVNLLDTGEEKASHSGVANVLSMVMGIMIFSLLLAYGGQIMQGVIEEKSSKIVEILLSSVRPFQLMIGKILGIAAVSLFQFAIWIVLGFILSSIVLNFFGLTLPQTEAMQNASQMLSDMPTKPSVGVDNEFNEILTVILQLPFARIVFLFIFYFLGGYLFYGALFAAVGSAVDSAEEARQFQLPIMLPLMVGYGGLFTFVMNDPHGTSSFWLSMIPFTSPVAMMGRLAFDVPILQIMLSMSLLVVGVILAIWFASRIYRIGILASGAKVNFRILLKWFFMKN